MGYATVQDVQARMTATLTADEESICSALLEDAAVIVDAYAPNASEDAKSLVSIRMVMRCMETGDAGVPMGATQGSQSALGYSQSWTYGNGATGELYLSKTEKKLLGCGDAIGSYSPTQELIPPQTDVIIC